MSLGFIYGKAGYDRQQIILEQLSQWQESAEVSEIFYIVPDHIKFESEVMVLDFLRHQQGATDKIYAASNIQTFSFSRLLWYFLKEQPALTKTRLTSTGLSMIITHILHEFEEQELFVFTRERNSQGFSKKLAEQLIELKLGGYTPEDIEKLSEGLQKSDSNEQVDLGLRLHDLALVYRRFEEYIAGKYLDAANSLDELIQYLQQVDLSHSCFIIDGFNVFNAKEKEIICVLLQKAAQVRIGLTLDHKYLSEKPGYDNMFYQPGKIYFELAHKASKLHVPLLFDRKATHARVTDDLRTVEDFWINSQAMTPAQSYALSQPESLTIAETPDRVREVRYVAAKIRQLVFTGKYSYHDFLILTPQQDKYDNLLENVMAEYQIPVFTDLNKTMLNHPLVEFILALFSVRQQNYSYRSIMRLLKTEIFVPDIGEGHWNLGTFRNTLDLLENCILQNGYFKEFNWAQKEDWFVETCGIQPNESSEHHQQRERELPNNRYANKLRHVVFLTLSHFFERIEKVHSGHEFAVVLINFLEKIHVPQTLQGWQTSAAKDLEHDPERLTGSISDVSRHEEVWNTLCSLLDEYDTALGSEPLDLDEFIAIIQNGFETARYSQVPSTLDQVIFSESGVVQMPNRAILFFIGVTNDAMPRTIENDALLNDEDRDEIEKLSAENENADKYLAETSAIQMSEEPFANYLAFMSAKERIFFSYPLNDNDGKSLQISPYVERIRQAFGISIDRPEKQLDPAADEIWDLIGTPQTSLGELLAVSRDAYHAGKELHATWRGLLRFLLSNYLPRTEKLIKSLGFANEILPGQIADQEGHKYLNVHLVDRLYGEHMNTSISKLETFFADPYQYFLEYGLKLQPRKEFTLQPADTGQYFHAIMENFFQNVLREHKDLSEINSGEFDELLAITLQQVEAKLGANVFNSTARYRFIKKQLDQTADQVIHAIARQRSQRRIYTVKTETSFGDHQELPGLTFEDQKDPSKHQMNVRGRIDRIDLVNGADNKLYFNVIDYKSGNPELKMEHFLLRNYYGLSLQLLTYLRALQQGAQNGSLMRLLGNNTAIKKLGAPKLGSASYLHLIDPVIEGNTKDLAAQLDKSFMYKGIFRRGNDDSNQENGFLLALDKNVEKAASSGGTAKSNNYPIKYVKSKHDFRTNSTKSLLLTIDQIKQLLEYNDRKIEQARENIYAGMIDLAPYRLGQSTALDYSDYQEIMMFDPLLDQNNYRKIPLLSDQDIWSEIKKILNEQGK